MTTVVPTSAIAERYTLRGGVFAAKMPDGSTRLLAWPHAETLGVLGPGREAVLTTLANGQHVRADLDAIAPPADVESMLDHLRAGGWLAITVDSSGRPLHTVVPLRSPDDHAESAVDLALSRFVVIRRDGDDYVIESPLSWCEIRVHNASALSVLSGMPTSDPALDRLRRDLMRAGMLVSAATEDGELRTRQWHPHELWFHSRSRLGHRGYLGAGFGGTFWAKGTFEALPAHPEDYPSPLIPLPEPDLAELRRTDPSLTTVLEDRRSLRRHDDSMPITRTQLGEFLYRTARTRLVREIDDVEYVSRPYPSGGSVYELELYPVIRLAEGLAAGMYHYDSHEHGLRMVADSGHPAVRRMLRVATHGSAIAEPPQVLLVVSARVGRLMWKYEQMAYALLLKHVGVLYQTMCCVATAMGLAACPLGSGDSVAFAEAAGRDPLVECGVGEFLLGSVLESR